MNCNFSDSASSHSGPRRYVRRPKFVSASGPMKVHPCLLVTSRASKKKVSGRPYLVEFPRVSILSPYVFGLLAVADEKTFAEFLCINHDVLSRFEETMRIASLGCQLQFGDSPTDVVLESVGSESAISFDETVIGQLSIRRGDAETVIKLLDGLLEMVVGVMDKIPVGLLLTRFEKLLFLSKISCRLSNFLSLVVGCSAFSSDSKDFWRSKTFPTNVSAFEDES